MAIAVELEVLTRTRVITSEPHSLVCAALSLLLLVTPRVELSQSKVQLGTVEPLYRGHHWDPAGCPVYSGTSQ